MDDKTLVTLENTLLRLTVGSDCIVQSLVYKPTGEECLMQGEEIALFSVTQPRPFNNEVKLAHPNKRTTFQANSLRREGNRLIMGFEIIPYEAVVEVQEREQYISFRLAEFLLTPKCYGGLCMDVPPVAEFRLIQLPIRERGHFGEWLNVNWDDSVAVNVLATSPYARIDSERRKGYRVMTADAVQGIQLLQCEAALIVNRTDWLLDSIAVLEEDYDLPRGVESRRSEQINRSGYWTTYINPDNVDTHIAAIQEGGLSNILIYSTAFFYNGGPGYSHYGDYQYRPEYPNGFADLKAMLDKIKAAGITPGLHVLHTHIGFKSSYVTPVADSRLNLVRNFTLAKPLGMSDTTIYVQQNPAGALMHPKRRVLQFGGELISYEGFSTEPPYCFTGCVRGHFDTNVTEHPAGTVGGILDISEYGGTSVYLDQNSDLQEEIADKLAEAYSAGFEFVYFDGSEGTNPPYEFHVPNAQYRVYKKLQPKPLYCEGAAKAHFSWHMLSGGNAFDTFAPNVFKQRLTEHPAAEAPRMQDDFTRLNFGWWGTTDFQPDMYEYGTSRAAAWDCPTTLMTTWGKNFDYMQQPRWHDLLEVLHRWEDVRKTNWLTQEQKEQLKDLKQEHILLVNETGAFELQPYWELETGAEAVSAFFFTRADKSYVVCWHKTGSGTLTLPLVDGNICYEKQLGAQQLPIAATDGGIQLPLAGRAYLSCDLPEDALREAFRNCTCTDIHG